tara:strand:- start:43236 stop:44177 length:942 start_codon:yes stop_codon:yes gene_type:complete
MDAIKVDSVTRFYGEHTAVDDLSFTVNKGHIHGFLGPNGAGKTTTMKMIAGLLPAHRGQIQINSKPLEQNINELKLELGILLENPPLFQDMEVREYLDFVARLHKVPKDQIQKSVDYAIEKLRLGDVAQRLCGNLSKGFKQRVGIAQAIVHNPSIVILDEPTVGLDPQAVIEIREFIKELKEDHTLLLSSHLLHEVSLVCDEVTIINKGKLVVSGPVEEITNNFNKQAQIEVSAKSLSDEQIKKIENWFFIDKVILGNNDKEEVSFQLSLSSINDHRHECLKNLMDINVEVISYKQQKMSLEDLFIRMTKGAQ